MSVSSGVKNTTAPAVDPAALTAIREIASDSAPDLLAQVIKMYFASAPELLAALKSGIDAQDFIQIRNAAHSMKSSSANLGAYRLADLCKRLEMAARDGRWSDELPQLEQIESEYAAVVAALEQEIGS